MYFFKGKCAVPSIVKNLPDGRTEAAIFSHIRRPLCGHRGRGVAISSPSRWCACWARARARLRSCCQKMTVQTSTSYLRPRTCETLVFQITLTLVREYVRRCLCARLFYCCLLLILVDVLCCCELFLFLSFHDPARACSISYRPEEAVGITRYGGFLQGSRRKKSSC